MKVRSLTIPTFFFAPDGVFKVFHTKDGVCTESRTFKYENNKRTIVAKGEACD